MGDRTTQQGYSQVDKVRQQFTGYERDNETGLDFAQARYFSSTQGRFLSPDAVAGSQLNPQTLNLYAYVQNNPLAFTDPTGHLAQKAGGESLLSPDDRSGCFGGRALRCGQEQQPSPPPPSGASRPLVDPSQPVVSDFDLALACSCLDPIPPSNSPVPSTLIATRESNTSRGVFVAGVEREYQLYDQSGQPLGTSSQEEGLPLYLGEEVMVVSGSVPDFPAVPKPEVQIDENGQAIDRPTLGYPGGNAPLPSNTNRVVLQLLYVVDGAQRYDLLLNRITFTQGNAKVEELARPVRVKK